MNEVAPHSPYLYPWKECKCLYEDNPSTTFRSVTEPY